MSCSPGVYGSGKSSVAEEIAYLLEQRGEPYALLNLDYLSWAGTGTTDRASEFGLMVQNLAAMAAAWLAALLGTPTTEILPTRQKLPVPPRGRR